MHNALHAHLGETASVTTGSMKDYPEALKEPAWDTVSRVYELAVEDGTTSAIATRLETEQTVTRFFVEEKKALTGRIGGAAQRAAKAENCNVKLYGPVSYALEKGVEKQLEKRRHADSQAFQLIEEQETALGTKNVKRLQEQAEALLQASHALYYGLEMEERELQGRLDQSAGVRATLEDQLEEERAREKPDKKRIQTLEEELTQLAQQVELAENLLPEAKQNRQKRVEAFEKELNLLLENCQERQQRQPSEESSKP